MKADEIKIIQSKEALNLWNNIRSAEAPCKSCGGYGEIRIILTENESEQETCQACGGSGIHR